MTEKRRLGRGLEAMLSRSDEIQHAGESQAPQERSTTGEGLLNLNVYEIDTNPFQPRTIFDEDEIASLSASIKEHGLLQPILVRRVGDRFQLIAGERRWRASIQAGLSEVPATVRDADDREVAEVTIVENLQRKDLGPLEKAASFQKYIEQYDCSKEELAQRLSIDRSTVANLIRLLELPEEVRNSLQDKSISAGHARALLPLGEEREQIDFCKKIQEEGLSVRATETLVSEKVRQEDSGPLGIVAGTNEPVTSRRDSQLASLEQELRTALGTKVELRQNAKGRGKITIHFNSHEEFDRLRAQLNDTSRPQSDLG